MLAVRFSVPAAPRILVHRPALLRRLTAGIERPLTLVSGAAGAGKTVLAAHWAASGEAPRATVWLTAERPDAPGVFWAYLLEAFRRHGVELPVAVGSPARTEGVDRSFLVRLAAALADLPEPVVLILDEFDTVSSREITDNLHFVLAHADGGLRLVLTGRVEPLLPLHRYRAAGDIAEIRNADLRFTVAEADELLRGHTLDVSPAGVRLLVRRTEGWAAGLRLCALAMQRGGDPEAFVREFAADRTTIADYLLTEVLDAQPPTTQDLLLRAGITDRVHPDLMDALTGRRDAEWTLARLARANAFLDRVDESDWYRLHPLFAEVLRAHLRHRCPGLEPRLHARAARWLAGTGRPTDAIVQATAAADWRFAAELMVDNLAIGRLFTGLESERLAHAFSGLPPDTPGAAAALVGAACRAADHDLDGCAAGLRRADAHPTGRAGPAARLGRALVGVLAGRLAGDPAATEHAAADVDRLLRRLRRRCANSTRRYRLWCGPDSARPSWVPGVWIAPKPNSAPPSRRATARERRTRCAMRWGRWPWSSCCAAGCAKPKRTRTARSRSPKRPRCRRTVPSASTTSSWRASRPSGTTSRRPAHNSTWPSRPPDRTPNPLRRSRPP